MTITDENVNLGRPKIKINYQTENLEVLIDGLWIKLITVYGDIPGGILSVIDHPQKYFEHVVSRVDQLNSEIYDIDWDTICEWINLKMQARFPDRYHVEMIDNEFKMIFEPAQYETLFWLKRG
jgi:hypothetical protein